MFYLTIPLAFALAAVAGIAVIVWRKMPFLRKLTPESHEVGETMLHDFAPEFIDWARGIPWRQYWQNFLIEIEKILRKLRLMVSSIDRLSGKVIRKVRRVHQETAKQQEVVEAQREAEKKEEEQEPDEIDMTDPEQLKQEEQRLIVAIAQNPREVKNYSDLAKVYMRIQAYSDVVEALEQAVKLEPANEQYLKRLERAKRKTAEAQV